MSQSNFFVFRDSNRKASSVTSSGAIERRGEPDNVLSPRRPACICGPYIRAVIAFPQKSWPSREISDFREKVKIPEKGGSLGPFLMRIPQEILRNPTPLEPKMAKFANFRLFSRFSGNLSKKRATALIYVTALIYGKVDLFTFQFRAVTDVQCVPDTGRRAVTPLCSNFLAF